MENNLIYDIGMHNGDDTAFYLSEGFNVIAIDASPDLVANARLRFSDYIKQKRLEILNIGIDSGEGILDFYLNKTDSVWNSFNKNIGIRGGKSYEVIKITTESIDTIIKNKGNPYYMKIDIEGNDIICLRSLLNIMERPVYISVELSDIELIYKLAELGYTGFKIIEQTSLLPLQIPPSKEHKAFTRHRVFKHSMKIYIRVVRKLFGRYINKALEGQYSNIFKYKHPFGSSGPFGNELAGNWLALNEVIEVYLYYKKLYESDKANIDYGYWIDIHATILESKPSEEI